MSLTRRELLKGMGACIALASIPIVGAVVKNKLNSYVTEKEAENYYLGRGTVYINGKPFGSCANFDVHVPHARLEAASKVLENSISFTLQDIDEENLKIIMNGG